MYTDNDFRLYHHGILGQKWGIRRFQNSDGSLTSAGKSRYKSTGIRAAIARRQNEKIDKSFKTWKQESAKRADAIEIGKRYNKARIDFEANKSKETKAEYKSLKKEYNSALRGNTTYRKGQIRNEVGSDLSRKYLSEAKKVDKLLKKDPGNKDLQRQYDSLMSKHDIERARARRAPEVAANRSRKIASIKRGITVSIKTAAVAGAIAVGSKVLNDYTGYKFDGTHLPTFEQIVEGAQKVKRGARFIY